MKVVRKKFAPRYKLGKFALVKVMRTTSKVGSSVLVT